MFLLVLTAHLMNHPGGMFADIFLFHLRMGDMRLLMNDRIEKFAGRSPVLCLVDPDGALLHIDFPEGPHRITHRPLEFFY